MTTKVLVVDDDPNTRQFVVELAAPIGFETLSAANGDEALACLAQTEIAVLVLDLQMPQTDGIKLMRKLAECGHKSKLILLSGSNRRMLTIASDIARCHGLEVLGCIQKPAERARLLDLLTEAYLELQPFSAAVLRKCLQSGRVEVHYQPKVMLSSSQLAGVEALLRCSDPLGRPVAPELVVSVADQAGLLDQIAEVTLRKSLSARQGWKRKGIDLSLAVNMSGRNTYNAEFTSRLVDLCNEYGVLPNALTIELTETEVMGDARLAAETMVQLRLAGFRLSIDDFGTGYSSLARLVQLPFNEVKIDKRFVCGGLGVCDNAVIIKTLAHMSLDLGLHCVVEGIEDTQTLQFAANCGCHEAQGYLIGRPVSVDEIEETVRTWHWRRGALHSQQTPMADGQALFARPE